MGILGAKNKVIAGDYIGGKIMHSGGKVVLSINLGNMIILNKKWLPPTKSKARSRAIIKSPLPLRTEGKACSNWMMHFAPLYWRSCFNHFRQSKRTSHFYFEKFFFCLKVLLPVRLFCPRSPVFPEAQTYFSYTPQPPAGQRGLHPEDSR